MMQLTNKIRPLAPHLIALLLFTVISFVYFYPVLEGKVLKANDSTVSTINSKEIRDFRKEQGREPLWTNSIFSGMPAYLISTLYPGNLIKHVDKVLRSYSMPVSVLFLSMAGFYLLLLIFGINPWLAVSGAVAYGFSTFFFSILSAGHNTQAIALAYMAPVVGGIYYAYRKNALKGALITALALSLEIQANHPQITYYSFMCLLVFGIVEFVYALKGKVVMKFLKTTAILIIPFIIAVGINFANLYTVYEYGKYSIRGRSDLVTENENITSGLDKDYITYWSYGVDESFNLLVPNYKGGSSKPFSRDSETVRTLRQNNAGEYADTILMYWGTQPGTDAPHYMGAIIIFLFILGLRLVKGPEKWWLLIATILSIMLAWGKNFMFLTDIFIDYFPGYNKFRAVTMVLVIAQFCIPLLGFIALRNLFNGTIARKEILKSIAIATGITGGFLLLTIVFPGIAGSFLGAEENVIYPDWLKEAIVTDRRSLLTTDSFRSLVFISLSAATLTGFIYEKIRKKQAIVIITILIVLDLWSVDRRYLNADKFERPANIQKAFTPSAADAFILTDSSTYRVLNLTVSPFNDNSPTSYFHKSIGGYHGAKLKRYQELIDSSLINDLISIQTVFESAQSIQDLDSVFYDTPAINMLNARYLIFNPEAPPLVNDRAFGNAWFVEKALLAENANEEISALKGCDPAKEAVIDKRFRDQIPETTFDHHAEDHIELVSYQPDELIYSYHAGEDKLVIFSEIYYPAGWKSYIDGKDSEYLRADYVLRGMYVPAGDHEIKFRFEPSSYFIGNKISLASSIILIVLLAGYFLAGKRFISRP